jgi:hypothetical protein
MADLRVFFGHHKCASRYFRMGVMKPLAEQLGWPVFEYTIGDPPFHFRRLDDLDLHNIDFESFGRVSDAVVNFSNASLRVVSALGDTGREFVALRVLRDPRQVLVSNYFHHLNGHNIDTGKWVWEKLKEDRPILRRLSLSDGLLYELNNITRELFETQLFAWRPGSETLEVRLEDFAEKPKFWRRRIAEHFDLSPELIDLPENRFANPSGRRWEDCFDDRLKDVFKERYADDLVTLGYATDAKW